MSKNQKTIDAIINRFKQATEVAVTPQESKRLGDLMARQVRTRTRLGYGATQNGSQRKLDRLSERYKEYREDHAEELSGATTPGRSNLTATGQMLDAIQAVGSRGKVVLELVGKRTGELGGRRSRLTNAQVAKYVQEQGRRFFDFTKAERNFLVREVKQLVLAQLRKK